MPTQEEELQAAAAAFLNESLGGEEVRQLSSVVQPATLDHCVDKLILRWAKSELLQATTERELIIFQAMVSSVMQIKHAIQSANSKPEDSNGRSRKSNMVDESAKRRIERASNYFYEPPEATGN